MGHLEGRNGRARCLTGPASVATDHGDRGNSRNRNCITFSPIIRKLDALSGAMPEMSCARPLRLNCETSQRHIYSRSLRKRFENAQEGAATEAGSDPVDSAWCAPDLARRTRRRPVGAHRGDKICGAVIRQRQLSRLTSANRVAITTLGATDANPLVIFR